MSAFLGLPPLAGVGLTPALHWTALSTTVPLMYDVEVWLVRNTPTGAFGIVAQLYTNEPSITLPSGILTTGEYYFVLVHTRTASTGTTGFAPYQFPLPRMRAYTLSRIFTP